MCIYYPELITKLYFFVRNIHSVRFSPDGERLAIACDKLLAIYIVGSGELEWCVNVSPLFRVPLTLVCRESTGSNDVLNLCFSHDSSMVATSSTDRNIRVRLIIGVCYRKDTESEYLRYGIYLRGK